MLIETNAGSAYTPQIVIDANGVGTAFWSQYNGYAYSVWVNRYVPGSGWGNPTNDVPSGKERGRRGKDA